jgi:hypothetical protein
VVRDTMFEWTAVPGEPTVMTVNDVVETTMNRVNGLSPAQSEQKRDGARIEAWEFELLLERAMEILSIREQKATAARS